mmetsp:Transcript_30199/g.59816  ORF Transcript_30199/g.59816 Transcript_30199/m.59816 type:complete len:203 (+) Transcript_30199:1003-1611(+)
MLEAVRIRHHTRLQPVAVQLVEHGRFHHGRGCTVPIHVAKRPTRRIPGTHVPVDTVGDPRQVGTLGQVVPAPAAPDQDVVGQMARDAVPLLFRVREGAGEQGDVFVVPRVPVGDRGAVGNAGDLVAVVPPGEDAGVGGRIFFQPPVGLTVVIHDDNIALIRLCLVHDRRVRQPHRHFITVLVKNRRNPVKSRKKSCRNNLFD